MYPQMMRFGLGRGWNQVSATDNIAGLWIYTVLDLVTWFLVIAVLVALLRWLWKQGDKRR